MEDLNKNQIILLTLLVSFVTSIATGIITVSLLQEAPLEVTRNINRIVEKTIETVTPGAIAPGPKEVTTVIVKEEDLIIDSINKNIKSIVRINEKDSVSGTSIFYGIGLVVGKDGKISSDRKVIVSENKYIATMSDETELDLTPLDPEKQTNFILFKANLPEKSTYTFSQAVFSDVEPKLGQTVIGLGGKTANAVMVGRVVSLMMKDVSVGTTTAKILTSIETDLASKDLVTGGPIFNLSGDVIGIQLSLDAPKTFTSIASLKKDIATLTPAETKAP
ncbi:MAG: hypothetical protein A3H52_00530 [Candidatus Zambryskibacteria bacterium RIFCSPLOWO2_02_FULL_39_26]|uniref:Serine protease n=1 Tax=Candidatus Zambryskibacteria bacterium RIFCSPLOWO2_12_FULL_39_23 TaxID=1802776 RepID=A0A1G2UV21_9BACT|nr:MAG: hypothetical protein A2W51_02425 [Candidatus Zambryskibacteria bacterium RIFCSPHIGHO2_02_39_10]OHA99895.1 MAG: hypothetical protein A3E59_00125 [Candidatus Zambryskibacteria bacterium RIFCSPHIGHO2_12_FULL_39_47]OHB09447.1 MAG: hypothetical protein A3H52_00530 [Candidatus Zambryskibacteria bacterium RIFCSPLOWO2_02_FULL_39_26]OHB13214.1 MAG: hypothetical protein A3G99_01130 [Candidatus Zambryskibacteria bacterium RIFCSPLOWO2_12_FULL_39_23]